MPDRKQDTSISGSHTHDGKPTLCTGRYCSGVTKQLCPVCRHALSFHGGARAKGPCTGYGCTCSAWVEKLALLVDWRPIDGKVSAELVVGQ